MSEPFAYDVFLSRSAKDIREVGLMPDRFASHRGRFPNDSTLSFQSRKPEFESAR